MTPHELRTIAGLANESIWLLRKTGQQVRYLEAVDIQSKLYAEANHLEAVAEHEAARDNIGDAPEIDHRHTVYCECRYGPDGLCTC